MNLQELVKYLSISIAFIDFMLILFTYFSLGSGLAITIPSLATVNVYQSNIQAASTGISSALTKPTITPTSCVNGDFVCIVYNGGIFLANIIIGFFSIAYNFVILLFNGISVAFLILFVLIPQLLNSINLGWLGTILSIINGAVIIILAFIAIEMIVAYLQSRNASSARSGGYK